MVVTLIEAHFLSASCNVGLKHHGLLTFFNRKGFPIQKILNIFVNQTVLVFFQFDGEKQARFGINWISYVFYVHAVAWVKNRIDWVWRNIKDNRK